VCGRGGRRGQGREREQDEDSVFKAKSSRFFPLPAKTLWGMMTSLPVRNRQNECYRFMNDSAVVAYSWVSNMLFV